MQFVRIGRHVINLDKVTMIHKFTLDTDTGKDGIALMFGAKHSDIIYSNEFGYKDLVTWLETLPTINQVEHK